MKWTIYQLHQMPKQSFEFDETVELNELTKLNSDIRRISPVREGQSGYQIQTGFV